jgi:hypothetical protein
MTDFYRSNNDKFKFGWEVELMVTDNDYNPLFGNSIPFNTIQDTINTVQVNEISYLKEKYKGSGLYPYYVEGYDSGYENNRVRDVTVKGIEIRTPIEFSIEDSIKSFNDYFYKIQNVVESKGQHLSCFGNHPFEPAFVGDRGQRDLINWTSAETAMTTHGLVINISLPDELEAKLNRETLINRFSYAAPTMILFAGNTPFRDGVLWRPNGIQGYSDRSYRRSFVRDTIYFRDDQNYRKEITLFDMTNDLNMYAAYAALSLGIILSNKELPFIPDRFSKENVSRISRFGYNTALIDRHFNEMMPEKIAETVLNMCEQSLEEYGFDTGLLNPLWKILNLRELPAHETIRQYQKTGSIQSILKDRTKLIEFRSSRIASAA